MKIIRKLRIEELFEGSLKKIQACLGFEPLTSAIPVTVLELKIKFWLDISDAYDQKMAYLVHCCWIELMRKIYLRS